MSLSLTDTLDLLKERGFSPGDRAFLAKEWMTFFVHFRGNRDPLHFTEYHKEREVFSEKLQEVIRDLKSPEQLSCRSDGYTEQRLHAFDESVGRDLSEQPQKLEFLKPRSDDYRSKRFGEAFLDDILNVLSESNDYQTFQEMDMDEDDLLVFLAKNPHKYQKIFHPPKVSLSKNLTKFSIRFSKKQTSPSALLTP